MKQKIPYLQNKCKSVVPEDHIHQMKQALKAIEYPGLIIGPSKFEEVMELNMDKTTKHHHCIFRELIEEKISLDYNTIKDGLEILDFYKSNNKYFTVFDNEIKLLADKIETQNKTKYATTEIIINTENVSLKDIIDSSEEYEKQWFVYFDGKLKSDKPDTLLKAIVFAKNCMGYHNYNKIEIKRERR